MFMFIYVYCCGSIGKGVPDDLLNSLNDLNQELEALKKSQLKVNSLRNLLALFTTII